jgi:hypothetical protein
MHYGFMLNPQTSAKVYRLLSMPIALRVHGCVVGEPFLLEVLS